MNNTGQTGKQNKARKPTITKRKKKKTNYCESKKECDTYNCRAEKYFTGPPDDECILKHLEIKYTTEARSIFFLDNRMLNTSECSRWLRRRASGRAPKRPGRASAINQWRSGRDCIAPCETGAHANPTSHYLCSPPPILYFSFRAGSKKQKGPRRMPMCIANARGCGNSSLKSTSLARETRIDSGDKYYSPRS